jgi:hypothetical protein
MASAIAIAMQGNMEFGNPVIEAYVMPGYHVIEAK